MLIFLFWIRSLWLSRSRALVCLTLNMNLISLRLILDKAGVWRSFNATAFWNSILPHLLCRVTASPHKERKRAAVKTTAKLWETAGVSTASYNSEKVRHAYVWWMMHSRHGERVLQRRRENLRILRALRVLLRERWSVWSLGLRSVWLFAL